MMTDDDQDRCWCGRIATDEIPEGMVGDILVVIRVCRKHASTENEEK